MKLGWHFERDNRYQASLLLQSLYGQQQVLIGLRLIRLANRVKLYAVLGGGPTETNQVRS